MATPYLLPKEAGSLVGSKLSQFNFCRATASRQRRCKRAQLPTSLTHFSATPRSVRFVVGRAEFSTEVQIGLLHYMTLSSNYFLHFMLIRFMLFILGR